MDNKDFDRLLREKFAKEPLREREDGWPQLSERLSNAGKRRPLFVILRVAAALLFLVGLSGGVLFLWNRQIVTPKDFSSASSSGKVNVEGKIKDLVPATDKPQDIHNAISQKSNVKQTNPENNGQEKAEQSWAQKGILSINKGIAPDATQNSKILATDSISKVDGSSYAAAETRQNQAEKGNVVVAPQQKDVMQSSQKLNFSNPLGASERDERGNAPYAKSSATTTSQQAHNTAIALGGGMNYGSLNAGYALGVSARHALGKHFFVEGSVAFLYHNQTPNTSNYPGPPTMPSRPASYAPNNPQPPSMKLVSDFYYVQVNPSFGYQVNSLLALSAGIDLQQRIASLSSQNGTAVFTPSTDPRIIPQLDFGLTGKTEFFISPKIEVGALYRNGLNNLVQTKDVHPFLNRRYIQVQLKYNFLLGK